MSIQPESSPNPLFRQPAAPKEGELGDSKQAFGRDVSREPQLSPSLEQFSEQVLEKTPKTEPSSKEFKADLEGKQIPSAIGQFQQEKFNELNDSAFSLDNDGMQMAREIFYRQTNHLPPALRNPSLIEQHARELIGRFMAAAPSYLRQAEPMTIELIAFVVVMENRYGTESVQEIFNAMHTGCPYDKFMALVETFKGTLKGDTSFIDPLQKEWMRQIEEGNLSPAISYEEFVLDQKQAELEAAKKQYQQQMNNADGREMAVHRYLKAYLAYTDALTASNLSEIQGFTHYEEGKVNYFDKSMMLITAIGDSFSGIGPDTLQLLELVLSRSTIKSISQTIEIQKREQLEEMDQAPHEIEDQLRENTNRVAASTTQLAKGQLKRFDRLMEQFVSEPGNMESLKQAISINPEIAQFLLTRLPASIFYQLGLLECLDQPALDNLPENLIRFLQQQYGALDQHISQIPIRLFRAAFDPDKLGRKDFPAHLAPYLTHEQLLTWAPKPETDIQDWIAQIRHQPNLIKALLEAKLLRPEWIQTWLQTIHVAREEFKEIIPLALAQCKYDDPAFVPIALDLAIGCNIPDQVNKILLENPSVVTLFNQGKIGDAAQPRDPLYQAILNKDWQTAHVLVEHGFAVDRIVKPNVHTIFNPILEIVDLLTRKYNYLTEHNDYLEAQKLAIHLIKHGIDVNRKVNTGVVGEISLTIAEKLFLDHGYSPRLTQELALILFDHGATITPRIAQQMKLEIQANGNPRFKDLLLQRGMVSEAEMSSSQAPKRALEDHLSDGLRFLQTHLTLYHLNPHLVDLNQVAALRLLKKEAKQQLAAMTPGAPETVALEALYKAFSNVYDTFVENHLFLTELRTFSQEIRSKSKIPVQYREASEGLLKFYSLWGADGSYGKANAAIRVNRIFGDHRKLYFQGMYTRAVAAAQRTSSSPTLMHRSITWLHASTSKLRPALLKTGALIPSGMLLEEGMVPITGEVTGTDKSINRNKLSGEKLTVNWEDAKEMYFDANTRLLVNFLYGTKEDGYKAQGLRFDPQAALKRASIENLHKLLEGQRLEHSVPMRIDILRLRITDPEAEIKLKPLYEEIVKLRKTADSDFLKELEGAFKMTLKYTYSPEDLNIIFGETSYPLIFASTSIAPEPVYSKNRDRVPEYLAEGKLLLGKDIQVVFTSADKVAEVQKLLGPLGVEVFDIDMAFYLETVNMIKGSEDLGLSQKEFSTQYRLSAVLQRDILPQYATPFPEKPAYRDANGNKVEIANPLYAPGTPDYKTYREQVASGTLLPRTSYGPMHASRAAIWSQLLANLLERHHRPPIKDRFHLSVAAATLDIARQDEGRNHWDADSVQFFKSYLVSRHLDFQGMNQWIEALQNKDSPDDRFTSDLQCIFHDVNCLERLSSKQKPFDPQQLAFYSLPGLDPALRDKLINEVGRFIALTENPELKQQLEQHSSHFYQAVLELVTVEEFPTLHSLLAKELREI
jgi:hypothetical protein